MTRPRIALLIALPLLVAIGAAWLWHLYLAEPMASFRTFPYTYISEAGAGYDASAVVIDTGSIDGPASVSTDGLTAWPAYTDPSGMIVPLKGGKPYILPLIPAGDVMRTPLVKPLGRALTAREIDRLVRYQTAEGAVRMAAFRSEMLP